MRVEAPERDAQSVGWPRSHLGGTRGRDDATEEVLVLYGGSRRVPSPGGIGMPALPWTSVRDVDRDREYVAMASRLPLKHYRSIPGFLRDTLRIRRQLSRTRGLVGYSLNAQPARKTFWTLSVWTDDASLRAFASADPHRTIVARLRPRMNETRFEFFTVAGNDVPLSWGDAMARLR